MTLIIKPGLKARLLQALVDHDAAFVGDQADGVVVQDKCFMRFNEMRFCAGRQIKLYWRGRHVHTVQAPAIDGELTLTDFEGRLEVEITL